MSGETRCPTCGTPIKYEEAVVELDIVHRHHDGSEGKGLGWSTIYRAVPKATDPTRVARMEELLMDVLTDVDDDFDGFSSVRDDIIRFFGRDPDTEPWPSVREVATG